MLDGSEWSASCPDRATPGREPRLLAEYVSRLRLKCDDTRAETRFRLSAKRTSPFQSAVGRQFSRLLAAEVCASAVVMLDTPMFRVSVKSIGYPVHSPVSTFTSPPVRYRVPSYFNWTLLRCFTIPQSSARSIE